MIRRIYRTLPWFGAVVALFMLALPVQADEMEPEPYVEEEVESEPEPEPEPEVEEQAETGIAVESGHYERLIFDFMVLRPLQLARLVVGVPFFIFYPFTIASGYDEDVVELLWTEPFEATFYRPLGEVPSDY
jgi:hypothetical protein